VNLRAAASITAIENGVTAGRVDRVRGWLFLALGIGLVGTETELVLLEHYEDLWQCVPLVLVAAAGGLLVLHWRRSDAMSRHALTVLMLVFVVAGVAGVVLHFRGAAEFQLETDPGLGRWDLLKRAMTSKAPPLLAPGVMLQLGLIGLAYTASDADARHTGVD
jgi:hypothetical protein